jgi:hypothetical protein
MSAVNSGTLTPHACCLNEVEHEVLLSLGRSRRFRQPGRVPQLRALDAGTGQRWTGQVDVPYRHTDGQGSIGVAEVWYLHVQSRETWRLVWPEPPFDGIFKKIP